jgi:ABC-type glycerol-3-phosphate transport system substrate-binding protein
LLVLAGYRLTKDFTDFEEPVKSDEDYEGIWNRVRSFVNDFRATDFNPGLAMFGNMYMQFGGELEVKDGNLKLDVKPAVDAISMMAQMFYKDGLATLTQAFDHQNNFVAGKLLAIQGSCVSKSFMETQIRFKWAMAPLPGGVKKAAIMQGTNVILFNNRSKKRSDASYKFISWFSKDENTAYWSRYTNYLPVRKNAGNEPVLKEYLQNESQIHPEALIKQMNDACFEPRDSAWFKSRDVLGQKLQDVMILIEKQVKSKNAYQNESVRELIEEEVNKINTQIGEIYQYYQ